jgi:hypothetical protein
MGVSDFTIPAFGRHVIISSGITAALTEAGFEVLTAVATKITLFWFLIVCISERAKTYGGTNRI